MRALLLFALAAAQLAAQPVASVRAGLVYHVEGAVTADGEALDPAALRFVQLEPGSRLETRRGFAEVALGPERTLRVGPGTILELWRDDIEDAAFRLVRGSVIVDWNFQKKGGKAQIQTGDATVEVRRAALVRIDSRGSPPRLRVYEGKAHVSGGVSVRRGRELSLGGDDTAPRAFDVRRRDFFDRWSARRARAAARMTRAGVRRRRPPRGGGAGMEASRRGPGRDLGGGDPF